VVSELLRYSCQIALPGFGESTQQKLQNAKVLIAGAGGLGCPSAQYLTAAGVGTIGIADYDVISTGNLHRQILFTPEEIGQKKVFVACEKLQRQNPGIQLIPLDKNITSENVINIIEQYDIVIDATDNFETKYLLNDACVLKGIPLVYGAIFQYEGQVAVWNILNEDGSRSPNYRDLFPNANASQIPNCAEGGVIPTLAGIIGCMQANEVIKYITKTGELLAGRLLMLDVQTMQSHIIKTGLSTNTTITALTKTVFIPTISVKDFKKVMNENNYELVDVRTTEERKEFNIGGKHIPLNEIEKEISFFNNEKSLVLYCASGSRSKEAVSLLKNKFPDKNIFSLEGGVKAWKEEM
jgi:molybdopterin/thiamine biosynthesis adenylyltransferase/rhodanese-related sulfurtransferase